MQNHHHCRRHDYHSQKTNHVLLLLFFLTMMLMSVSIGALAAKDVTSTTSTVSLHHGGSHQESALTTTTNNNNNNNNNNKSKQQQLRKLQFPDFGLDLDNLDWSQLDLENFDWGNIDLQGIHWSDIFLPNDGANICPIIEGLVGIGEAFGIAGGCICDGTIQDGLTVECQFDNECIEPWVCGSIGFNVSLGDALGSIAADICVDLVGSVPEICYGYMLNVADGTAEQSCTASYDGEPCLCEIDNTACLQLNCSRYLPGAAMDTCQLVNHHHHQFETEADSANLVPRFQFMEPDFHLNFNFGEFDWTQLDWMNLDWLNFDLNAFWNSRSPSEWLEMTWNDIFGNHDFDVNAFCPALEHFAGLGESFGIAGGCTCDGNFMDGLDIDCSFDNNLCDGMVLPAASAATPAVDHILSSCARVDFNMSFGETPGLFTTNVCVDWPNHEHDDDTGGDVLLPMSTTATTAMTNSHPTICYSYNLSVVDSTVTQTCEAFYNGNECICDIESSCIRINCNSYLPGAEMDTCQYLGVLETEADATRLVPRFQAFEPDFDLGSYLESHSDWMLHLDWNNVDWPNFDLDSFWESRTDWSWSDIFGSSNLEELDMTTICPALEYFVGIGQAFGVAGECSCDGSLPEGGLGIDCSFDNQCLLDPALCGSVDFTISLAETPGLYSTNICVDWDNGEFPEICYGYDLNFLDATTNGVTQSCTATYDNNACICEITDSCLLINCGAYLPGAVMESCLDLTGAIEAANDAVALLPRFHVFDPDFELPFEQIDWMNLDWTNLDWRHFDIDSLWNHSNWASTDWSDIFDTNIDATTICPVLEHVAGIGEEFGIAGGCICAGDITSGLNLDCSFENVCALEDAEGADDLAALCGATSLTFGFDNGLGTISGEACVNFANDEHPITCFAYDIPLADQNTSPICTATYGGDPCVCEIDENFCVSINCSDHNENAVTDTCQALAWTAAGDITAFVPRFAVAPPSQDSVVTDESENMAAGTVDGDGEVSPPELEQTDHEVTNTADGSGGTGYTSQSVLLTVFGLGSILLLL